MRYIVISIIAFISTYTYSQNTFNYLGALVLANNSPISFSLELKEDNGIVNGYSITNINTPDETKSEISGLYFKEDKSFQLQETQILQSAVQGAWRKPENSRNAQPIHGPCIPLQSFPDRLS